MIISVALDGWNPSIFYLFRNDNKPASLLTSLPLSFPPPLGLTYQVHPADVAPRVGGVGEELPAAEAHPLRRPRPRDDAEEVPRRPSHKVAGHSGQRHHLWVWGRAEGGREGRNI